MDDNTPFIIKQADAMCKFLAVMAGKNGKINEKLMNKCEDDIELAFQKNQLDDWKDKYKKIYGEDNMNKAEAIQAVVQELINDSKNQIK